MDWPLPLILDAELSIWIPNMGYSDLPVSERGKSVFDGLLQTPENRDCVCIVNVVNSLEGAALRAVKSLFLKVFVEAI